MKQKSTKLFWLFIFGSVFGYILEMIYCSYRRNEFVVRPGLLYGPFIPIYGVGIVVLFIIAYKMKNKYLIFFNCAILGGFVEYMFSLLQEVIFNTKSWDYSDRFLNIDGRVDLFHIISWGLLGYLFVIFIYPKLQKWLESIPFEKCKIVTILLLLFMIYNIAISSAAVIRQEQRRKNIAATTSFQEYLDKKYPDELLESIFYSKKVVKE